MKKYTIIFTVDDFPIKHTYDIFARNKLIASLALSEIKEFWKPQKVTLIDIIEQVQSA